MCALYNRLIEMFVKLSLICRIHLVISHEVKQITFQDIKSHLILFAGQIQGNEILQNYFVCVFTFHIFALVF